MLGQCARCPAPDGHDPLHSPAQPAEKTYRIVAVSPGAGTPTGRHDAVAVELAELDPTQPAAFRPCDWVTGAEAGRVLGGPVNLEPYGDQTGSVDLACIYNKPADMGDGVEVDLQVAGRLSRRCGVAVRAGVSARHRRRRRRCQGCLCRRPHDLAADHHAAVCCSAVTGCCG